MGQKFRKVPYQIQQSNKNKNGIKTNCKCNIKQNENKIKFGKYKWQWIPEGRSCGEIKKLGSKFWQRYIPRATCAWSSEYQTGECMVEMHIRYIPVDIRSTEASMYTEVRVYPEPLFFDFKHNLNQMNG